MRARDVSALTYLMATAATFREARKMVDAVLLVAKEETGSILQRTRAEDVV